MVRPGVTDLYSYVGVCGSLPTAGVEYLYQMRIVAGAGSRDRLYVCLYSGSAYEWVDLTDLWDGELTTALEIDVLSTAALAIKNGSNANRVVVDTTNGELELRNGVDLKVYSDDGSTTKATLDGATGSFDTLGTVTVTTDGTAALKVEKADSTDVLVVDTTNKEVELHQGTDLIVYSDAGSTEKARIDGALGTITTIGAVTITRDGTQSLLVEKADGSDVFVVDTTNKDVNVRSASQLRFLDAVDALVAYIDAATGEIFGQNMRVTADTSAALLVEQADGDNVFVVATNSTAGLVSVQNGADIVWFSDQATTEQYRINGENGHTKSSGTSPSISAGAAAGTSPTVAILGTDKSGRIQVTTGTSPATGTLATVTFANAYPTANLSIVMWPCDSDAAVAATKVYTPAANVSTTAFEMHVTGSALPASTSHFWFYAIEEYEP